VEEAIRKRLQKLAEAIHFFGRYSECDLLLRISMYLNLKGIETDEELNDAIKEMMPDDHIIERLEQ